MSEVIVEPTVNTIAQVEIIAAISESREHMLTGIDLESEGGKGLATMYDRGVSDALSAVTGTATLSVSIPAEEGGEPVTHEIIGSELIDLFWAKVNN